MPAGARHPLMNSHEMAVPSSSVAALKRWTSPVVSPISDARVAAEPMSSHDEYVVLRVSQVPVSVFHVAPASLAAPSMLAVMGSANVCGVMAPVLTFRHNPRVSAPVPLSG